MSHTVKGTGALKMFPWLPDRCADIWAPVVSLGLPSIFVRRSGTKQTCIFNALKPSAALRRRRKGRDVTLDGGRPAEVF